MRMSAEKPVRCRWGFGVRKWSENFQNTNVTFKKLNIYQQFFDKTTIIIIIIIIIIILTPWSRVLLEKLTGSQLVNKFLPLYGTWRFITKVTRARHLSLSWARSIQSMPPVPIAEDPFYIILLFWPGIFHLVSFPQLSPTKFCLQLSLIPNFPHALPISVLITHISFGEQYRSLSSSLCVSCSPLLPRPS